MCLIVSLPMIISNDLMSPKISDLAESESYFEIRIRPNPSPNLGFGRSLVLSIHTIITSYIFFALQPLAWRLDKSRKRKNQKLSKSGEILLNSMTKCLKLMKAIRFQWKSVEILMLFFGYP